MRIIIATLLLALAGFTTSLFADDFTLCTGKFALCTTAPCTSIPGVEGWASCKCKVLKGYSVGTKPCEKVQHSPQGQVVYSRYSPIKSYVRCTNKRPWAWCLDSKCVIDKDNPSMAACMCSLVQDKGDYMIVTNHDSETACTEGLYSSALVVQGDQITDFLKTRSELPPYPIKVLGRH